MAHDYAKRPQNGRKKKKTGISSGPIWLITGLLCGFFLAFLLQLGGFSLVPNRTTPTERAPTPLADTPATTNEQEQAQAAKKPRFEFYSLLPETQVEVADEAEVPVVESSSTLTKPNTQLNSPLTSNLPAANGTRYVLQAGSFKRLTDADRRRARLLLMGLEANIERVKLSAFDSRHRVLVGPYTSRRDAAKASNQLTRAKVDTLLLERKSP